MKIIKYNRHETSCNDNSLIIVDKSKKRRRFKHYNKFELALLALTTLTSVSYAGLTGTTIQTIKGNAPTFILGSDGIDFNNFQFFGIRYQQKSYTDATTLGQAFYAKNSSKSPSTITPNDIYINTGNTNGNSLEMMPLIIQNVTPELYVDPDGDVSDSMLPIRTATADAIVLDWYNTSAGLDSPIKLTDDQLKLSLCELSASGIYPTLLVTGTIRLQTEYGDPRYQAYPDELLGYSAPRRYFPFIWPKPELCSVRPNISGMGSFTGPASEWNPKLGFLKQPTGTRNFPTTGSDGLYFDLIMAGADATTMDWQIVPASSGGITPTISIVDGNTRVTLNGPKPSNDTASAKADNFAGSATFTIQGYLKSNNSLQISYPFTIDKWFLSYTKNGKGVNLSAAKSYCQNVGSTTTTYALSGIRELSNTNQWSVPALKPSSTGTISRTIQGGLIAEWGNFTKITDNFMISNWTSDSVGSKAYGVGVNDGSITSPTNTVATTWGALCVNTK
ncbi:hypothetical protein DES39_0427 [Orbus hercynius]|uniref:Uncharacterized protein n=1 Tax=Orbus hercynius TaxID=593135 RepID=A0A495RKA1_9GAMM|nr:hypothetical protein [Orbus hercynius]RKS87208.1 hypothetical protein DES39_0427 [Orbus hercynius]